MHVIIVFFLLLFLLIFSFSVIPSHFPHNKFTWVSSRRRTECALATAACKTSIFFRSRNERRVTVSSLRIHGNRWTLVLPVGSPERKARAIYSASTRILRIYTVPTDRLLYSRSILCFSRRRVRPTYLYSSYTK